MDMVTNIGGSIFGFEFKRGDVPQVTKSMRVAADDLGLSRVFQIHPGPDTFPMEESGRFVALAWRDLSSLPSLTS